MNWNLLSDDEKKRISILYEIGIRRNRNPIANFWDLRARVLCGARGGGGSLEEVRDCNVKPDLFRFPPRNWSYWVSALGIRARRQVSRVSPRLENLLPLRERKGLERCLTLRNGWGKLRGKIRYKYSRDIRTTCEYVSSRITRNNICSTISRRETWIQ